MAIRLIENIGRATNDSLAGIGDFSIFSARAVRWLFTGSLQWKNIRLVFPQLYEVGVRSIPVVCIVGAFIGMVMAVETLPQFRSIGQEGRLGSVIFLSVVKQIGPVLAAVMLSGRVGGALAAELGTMNVTEQLDALRVMGSDPIRYLVVPRVVACVLLTPILTMYSDAMGMGGGWLVAVKFLGVPGHPFWKYAQQGVDMWSINEGIIKSFFFGAAIGLISCYKGFNCGSGASGVGRACTESFVASFVAIIVMNFFFADIARGWHTALFGNQSIFAG
ncbi:MAG TPA: ABC transporter permease [Tepidisphaeraceae bacterium]|nr:ABC transporter permease [Tepidisphaeraceae bacterium]